MSTANIHISLSSPINRVYGRLCDPPTFNGTHRKAHLSLCELLRVSCSLATFTKSRNNLISAGKKKHTFSVSNTQARVRPTALCSVRGCRIPLNSVLNHVFACFAIPSFRVLEPTTISYLNSAQSRTHKPTCLWVTNERNQLVLLLPRDTKF